MSNEFWGSNVCCIVTGASKGFGKAICLFFAKRFIELHTKNGKLEPNKKISFVLMSRDQAMLDELQKQLDALSPAVHVIEVITSPLEALNTVRDFENAAKTFAQVGPPYDHAILIHNAGSLGDPNKLVSQYSTDDSNHLINYMEINFSSVVKLTGAFLRSFANSPARNIINVTSLLALEPYKGLSLYGAVKAARDSYFRSVAFEDPETLVLSYAPGILDTNMADTLRKQGYNKEIYNNPSNVLDPSASVNKLIMILESRKFKSGDHIDYYQNL